MKRLFQLVLLVLWVGNVIAQDTVSLADGRLSFSVPSGFRALTDQEITLKYPSARPPQYVYANDGGGVSIAVTFSETVVSLEQLTELKLVLEQTLPRMVPGLQWLVREEAEINGRPWVHFELTSSAIDTDIHNHMYMTSFDGRMLGINMNSTVGEYEAVMGALTQSRDSIRVVE